MKSAMYIVRRSIIAPSRLLAKASRAWVRATSNRDPRLGQGTIASPLPAAESTGCCRSSPVKIPTSSTDVVWNEMLPIEMRASKTIVRSARRSPGAAAPIATDLKRVFKTSPRPSVTRRGSSVGSMPIRMPRASSR